MFGNKQPKKNAAGREYGTKQTGGPFTAEEIATAKQCIDDIGSQKERGFIIVVKRKTLSETGDFETTEIDGMIKASDVNRKFMLDTVFLALGMDDNEILKYMALRQKVGTEYDNEDK